MKNSALINGILALGVISSFSCSKSIDELDDMMSQPVLEPCVIEATVEDTTRTHISGTASGQATVVWDEGDKISFMSTDKGGNICMQASNISGTSATFSGSVIDGTTTFATVYPYTEGASFNSGSIQGFSIPTIQNARAGSFDKNMLLSMAKGVKQIGISTITNLQFKSLCAVVAFTLPSNITFATEITVSSKHGEKIAGAVSIDYANASISNPNAGSITIKPASGNFASGSTYYVVIAPGTYTEGLNFTINTAGGNSYSRSTTKTLQATAGGIYTLGTLSLELSASNFTSSVTLSDRVSSNTLNGTDAKFTMSMKTSEFSGIFKLKSYSVNFNDASSNVFRTLSDTTTTMPSAVTMTEQSGKPYIPKGTYTYEVTVNYTINNGTKDVDKSATFSGSVTRSNSPSGFAIDANLSGYTSYSCYKGTDGQSASAANANNCDNSTIYSVGASYKSGLSSDVYAQCSSLLSITSKLDGNAKSGNQGSQSWAAHTISASWSFDGVSGNCSSTKTVYVTGLPYNKSESNFYSTQGDWTKSGGKSEIIDNNYLRYGKGCTVTFKGFALPSNVTADVSYKVYCYGAVYTEGARCKSQLNIAGNTIFNESFKGTAKTVEHVETKTVTFTQSYNTVWVKDDSRASTWGDSHSQLFYMYAKYK